MNTNSKICQFIKENPNNWEEILKNDYLIKVKKEDNLAIFNYEIFADFYNPIVQEARGIIIDINTLEVVCWPFRKFGNYNCGYEDNIDWDSAKVQEKLDGSIIKLWYDNQKSSWRWSTNSQIAPESKFLELINKCPAPSKEWLKGLNKELTYIFELISPRNQIVIRYNETKLVHLGTRNNKTGEELNINIGFDKPKSYKLKSLDECVNFSKQLNKDNICSYEGFVVVDKNYNRIKIKSPEYLTWHHMMTNKKINKSNLLYMIIKTPEMLDDFISLYPDYKNELEFYQKEWNNFIANIDYFISQIRLDYILHDENKKYIALEVNNHPYKMFAFNCLNNKKDANTLILDTINKYNTNTINNKILDFIPNYPNENHLYFNNDKDNDKDRE